LPILLGIHGTVTNPGRLHQALQRALEAASAHDPSVTTGLRRKRTEMTLSGCWSG